MAIDKTKLQKSIQNTANKVQTKKKFKEITKNVQSNQKSLFDSDTKKRVDSKRNDDANNIFSSLTSKDSNPVKADSIQEVYKSWGYNDVQASTLASVYDINSDGAIEFDEMQAVYEAVNSHTTIEGLFANDENNMVTDEDLIKLIESKDGEYDNEKNDIADGLDEVSRIFYEETGNQSETYKDEKNLLGNSYVTQYNKKQIVALDNLIGSDKGEYQITQSSDGKSIILSDGTKKVTIDVNGDITKCEGLSADDIDDNTKDKYNFEEGKTYSLEIRGDEYIYFDSDGNEVQPKSEEESDVKEGMFTPEAQAVTSYDRSDSNRPAIALHTADTSVSHGSSNEAQYADKTLIDSDKYYDMFKGDKSTYVDNFSSQLINDLADFYQIPTDSDNSITDEGVSQLKQVFMQMAEKNGVTVENSDSLSDEDYILKIAESFANQSTDGSIENDYIDITGISIDKSAKTKETEQPSDADKTEEVPEQTETTETPEDVETDETPADETGKDEPQDTAQEVIENNAFKYISAILGGDQSSLSATEFGKLSSLEDSYIADTTIDDDGNYIISFNTEDDSKSAKAIYDKSGNLVALDNVPYNIINSLLPDDNKSYIEKIKASDENAKYSYLIDNDNKVQISVSIDNLTNLDGLNLDSDMTDKLSAYTGAGITLTYNGAAKVQGATVKLSNGTEVEYDSKGNIKNIELNTPVSDTDREALIKLVENNPANAAALLGMINSGDNVSVVFDNKFDAYTLKINGNGVEKEIITNMEGFVTYAENLTQKELEQFADENVYNEYDFESDTKGLLYRYDKSDGKIEISGEAEVKQDPVEQVESEPQTDEQVELESQTDEPYTYLEFSESPDLPDIEDKQIGTDLFSKIVNEINNGVSNALKFVQDTFNVYDYSDAKNEALFNAFDEYIHKLYPNIKYSGADKFQFATSENGIEILNVSHFTNGEYKNFQFKLDGLSVADADTIKSVNSLNEDSMIRLLLTNISAGEVQSVVKNNDNTYTVVLKNGDNLMYDKSGAIIKTRRNKLSEVEF